MYGLNNSTRQYLSATPRRDKKNEITIDIKLFNMILFEGSKKIEGIILFA